MKDMKQNRPLGKGISALLGSKIINEMKNGPIEPGSNPPELGLATQQLPFLLDINKIKENSEQPRKIFNDEKIQELSNSIKEIGIINPLIVQEKDNQFILISGERRLKAAKLAKLERVPVIVKKVTKQETVIMAIVENVQRDDLNCVEEALAYYQLMNEFSLNQDEVAKKIGKDRSTIANFLRILKLPREIIALVQKEELSFGHAKVLAALKDDEKIKRMGLMAAKEQMSVRELEKLIKKSTSEIAKSGSDTQSEIFNSSVENLKANLEKKTGFHFKIKTGKNGSGDIVIKFNNEAEFNDIYHYLVKP